MEKIDNSQCYVEDVITFLSKKWALLILRYLLEGETLRFNELLKSIGQISPRSLSQRLKELVELKIIKKQQYNEIPPRVEYSLTKSGEDLAKCFEALEEWGIKWGKSTFPRVLKILK